ncbi:MAG: FHA domain-containing protein [Gammaproteobacteria bacterium]|nr:FHA domain-containing protein [Gammaproteobacteria bacterium]
MNNGSYIIGRKGQIQLLDKTTSSKHAELSFLDDRLYLTDLNSTNGTYLLDHGERIRFKEGYIEMNQIVSFGNYICSVKELVARAQIESMA